MTIEELFTAEKVTLEKLDERSDESAYWLSCRNFITQNWKEQKNPLANKLYAEVFPILNMFESRGYNAHQRTQVLVKNLIEDAETWVLKSIHHRVKNE